MLLVAALAASVLLVRRHQARLDAIARERARIAEKLAVARARVEQLEAEHERLQMALANRVVSRSHHDKFSGEPELFQASVAELAKKHSLELVSLACAGVEPGSAPFYSRIAFEVTVVGKHPDFVAFLQSLSAQRRISNVSELHLEFSKERSGSIQASFVVSIFRLIPY
ncbi:MAG: type 4a pilus biogenesis protein PilO [Myxococcales bacterium]